MVQCGPQKVYNQLPFLCIQHIPVSRYFFVLPLLKREDNLSLRFLQSLLKNTDLTLMINLLLWQVSVTRCKKPQTMAFFSVVLTQNVRNQAACTDHYTVPHTLTLFFTNIMETFSINIHWQSIVALII